MAQHFLFVACLIYSMSKPITSVAVMQLVERVKLHLDDPLARYLSSPKDMNVLTGQGDDAKPEPAERGITVRDLLRHTSGMTGIHMIQIKPFRRNYGRRLKRIACQADMRPPADVSR